MIREIRKKMVILGNRSPFAQHTKDYINHLERLDWIYMNLNLDGSPLTRENVESILGGEMILTGRIMDHVLIERLDNLRNTIYRRESYGDGIAAGLAVQMASDFADGERSASELRKSTPTLQVYSYTPMLPPDIGSALTGLLAEAEHRGEFDNPFLKAAQLHNGFIKIYPFRENNEVIARALMEYYLVKQGFPMVPVTMSESEYNGAFVDYIKTGDSSILAGNLMKAVYDRLELMIQLTAY